MKTRMKNNEKSRKNSVKNRGTKTMKKIKTMNATMKIMNNSEKTMTPLEYNEKRMTNNKKTIKWNNNEK